MYNPNYNFFTPQGWKCPQCGRVYSPSTPMCYYCGGTEKKTITTDKTFSPEWEEYLKRTTTASPEQTDWKTWITSQTNIQDYPNWQKTFLNPTNVLDSDTFRAHFDDIIF